jgi:AraC-like DNA-binding protein
MAYKTATYGVSRRLGDVEFLSAHFTAHRFAPHSHEGFAVGAVRSGACRIWHRGTSYVARRGDLVLIDPGAPHSADPDASDAWDYCALYFTEGTARAWKARLPDRPAFKTVVAHDEALADHLESLCATLGEDPEHARAHADFGPFVDRLFTRFGHAASPRDGEGDSVPWTARRYIDAHYTEHVRIDDLAELTRRSPFSLIRAFTRAFGMPPYAYLTHLRIARAQDLLRAGRRISDTAFSVGFSDQSHLTRFFRRVVGVPPGVWLRGLRHGEDGPAMRGAGGN